MHRTLRRVTVPLVAALIVSIPAAARAAPLTDRDRAERGIAYLVSQQRPSGAIFGFSPIGSTADAVLAFVSAGVGRDQMKHAVAYLRHQVELGHVTDIGLEAKVVLAVTASGRDAQGFGGTNLVKAIRTQLDQHGHYGTSAVFDDALAVLAIGSAGLHPAARAGAWLLSAQCPDGGWAYDAPYDSGTDDAHCHSGPSDFFDADSNTTSYVMQALVAMGDTGWGADPFGFFDSVRDTVDGGWSYAASFLSTDTNSTALVIQAYVADGVALPSGALKGLRSLQYRACGAWAYAHDGGTLGDPDIGATIGAVPGLLRDPLPLGGKVTRGVPSVLSCR